jgi:hypothetical protein
MRVRGGRELKASADFRRHSPKQRSGQMSTVEFWGSQCWHRQGYLECRQKLRCAVNDQTGIERDDARYSLLADRSAAKDLPPSEMRFR